MSKEVRPMPIRGREWNPSHPRSWNEAMSSGIGKSNNPLNESYVCGEEVSGPIEFSLG